ncbi:MAG TPA: MBL fold metallo-hydrolase [Aldersonia sp.]
MTEQLTDQVAEGVHRIALPLPLDDLKSINAYAFESSAGLILVDPGWATVATECVLTAALAELGYGLRDVRTMIATHGHWDHYTQAVVLRDEYGGAVLLGAEERHSLDAFATLTRPQPRQVELLRAAGGPALAECIATLAYADHEKDIALGDPDGWLHDGDVLEFGDRTLTIHGTPGHTRGHVMIADEATGVMVTGDHILPRITPSIGLEREPEDVPLRSFLSSLRAMLELPDARMLPAHGSVSPSVHSRGALDWGLVNRVVPDADLLDTALEQARFLATRSITATREAKRLLAASMSSTHREQLSTELEAMLVCGAAQDARVGIWSFVERRRPVFTDR